MDHDSFSGLKALRQDQLDQLVLSARNDITAYMDSIQDDPSDPKQCRKALTAAFDMYVILTFCLEDASFFSDFILSLDTEKIFGKDSEEDLIRQYVFLIKEGSAIPQRKTNDTVCCEIPDSNVTAGLSEMETLVRFHEKYYAVQVKLLNMKNDFRNERNGERRHKMMDEGLKQIASETKELAGFLKKAEASCRSYLCAHHRLQILMTVFIEDSNHLCAGMEDIGFYDRYCDEALGIWSVWQNSDALRFYAQLELKAIENDLLLGMENRAKERFELIRNLIAQSGLIITDPKSCTAADAKLLSSLYKTYRSLYEDSWTWPSKLHILTKQAEYEERIMKLTGRLKDYIGVKVLEYKMRMEPVFITTREEALETLLYFEQELETQWICTPSGKQNKLVRLLHINMDTLRKALQNEENDV